MRIDVLDHLLIEDSADLKRWREMMHWTQKGAAEALGVSMRQFQSWERGKAEIPRMARLAALAFAVQLDMEFIVKVMAQFGARSHVVDGDVGVLAAMEQQEREAQGVNNVCHTFLTRSDT